MHTQPITTARGEILILMDDDYRIVQPVKAYFKFLYNLNKSPNTITTYCYHLKLYFEYLQEIGITYDQIFSDELPDTKGPLDYFADFIMYLQYPNYFHNIVNLKGEEPARTNQTINDIVNAVLSFYDYLSRNNKIKNVDAYKEVQVNSAYKDFFYGMHTNTVAKINNKSQETIKTNILKLKEPNEPVQFITQEQCVKLMESCRSLRNKLIICCGFYCGMRISEVLNLRISDLHLWENKIYIVPREGNINGARVKNSAAGVCNIPSDMALMFVKYLDQIENYDTDYVFINLQGPSKGEPMTKDNAEGIFKRLAKKVKFKATPHMLRHGYAVMRITNGASLLAVQKELRHQSIQSTLIYIDHFNEAQLGELEELYPTLAEDFKHEDLSFYKKGGLLCKNQDPVTAK